MRISRNSLAFRLLLSVALWVGVGTVSIGFLVSQLFRGNLEDSTHVELQEHFVELNGLVGLGPDGRPKIAQPLSDPRFLPFHSGFYWQVERAGFPTLASPSLGADRLPDDLARSSGIASGWRSGPTGPTLIYGQTKTFETGGAPVRLLMATDRSLLEGLMSQFNGTLIAALAAIAAVMLLGGIWHVAFTLVPLRRLTAAIGDIRQGRTNRMEGDFPAEVQPLVDDLNDLLQTREERAVHHRLRASNLAHGLRTPLTILMNEADQLEAAGHESAARVIMREAQRMSGHVNYHLARARAAIDQPKLSVEASLKGALTQLVPAMKRLYQSRDIQFIVDGDADLMLRCDAADLLEMLSNLLDNAGKWASTVCQIDWHVTNGLGVITIRDDGPGVKPEIASELFRPGERLDDTQPGSGLGLAITRELAAHYGGSVSLGGVLGQGCTVTLTLPCAERPGRS